MINPKISRRLLKMLVTDHNITEDLTDRETEILREISSGKSNKEIGERFFISESTVKTHISHIFQKIGVKSRAEAVSYGIKKGLI